MKIRTKIFGHAVLITAFGLSGMAYGQQPQSTPAPSTTSAAAPMSKDQQKAQRKQEKAQEKSAKENAKAAKAQEKAVKQQDKATNAAEKAGAARPATPTSAPN